MRKFWFGVLALAAVGFAADPRLEQGKVFEKAGEYDKAILEYKAILAENPQASEAYFAAAEAYVAMKNYSRALANYSLAYKFTPTMSEAYEGAAKVYELLGNKDKAAKERAKDPKNAPPAEEAVEEAAPAAEEAKPAEKAEAAKLAKAQEPAKAEPKSAKAEPAQAAEPSEKQAKNSGFTYDGPAFKKGRELFQAKDYAAAAEVWREVLRQQPGNPGAYYFAGAGRYELGELDKAEYNLKRAFAYPELGYNAHYYLSLIYKKRGNAKAEAKELKEYVKLTPNAQAKAKAEGRIAELEGGKAKAEKAGGKVAAPEPQQEAKAEKPEPKTEAKAEKAEEKVAAPEPQREAEAERPEPEVPASIDRGNELFAKGNLSGALSVYKELLETELPDDDRAFVLLQLGNIYRERRDFRLAVARYKEIVETFPDAVLATEAERAWRDAVWQENHPDVLPRKR